MHRFQFLKLLLILVFIFGVFSESPISEEDTSISAQTAKLENTLSAANIGQSLPQQALHFHACHLGHGGCFFKAPAEYKLSFGIESAQSYYLSFESNYLNPDLQTIDRPPIA